MYFKITQFLEEKKASMIFLYIFFCFLLSLYILLKYFFLTYEDEIYFKYYLNPGIRNIYITKIVCITVMLSAYLYKILNGLFLFKKAVSDKFITGILLISGVIICLITWYEFYCGSTFDYGENVRDKQGLSSLLIGTSLLLGMAISDLFTHKIQKGSLIFFIFCVLSFLIYLLQFGIFKMYCEAWLMCTS